MKDGLSSAVELESLPKYYKVIPARFVCLIKNRLINHLSPKGECLAGGG